MAALLFVSILWAFSFGLIKGQLTGLDPAMVAHLRLILCFLTFLPISLYLGRFKPNAKLMAIGAVQFGVMYLAYIESYQYLPGYLVAVFTIFTPIYVLLIDSIISKRLTFAWLLPILLSIGASSIMVFKMPNQDDLLIGFAILQVANIAFAIGQVSYKYVGSLSLKNHTANMVSLYLGASLLTGIFAWPALAANITAISQQQWSVILYLGVIASGVGFYLWNWGSQQVSSPLLAIMNNGYLSFALLFSLTIFNEGADITKLLLGSSLMAISLWWAHWLTKSGVDKSATKSSI
ncbi:EamA family transporter [Endozoicomonas sp. G2_1]|uniref:EamA family transporter n=1 Tax=Endozoicomonas sp. G2_1 TaxID=2821091 RepID=UPI001ADB790B|nr:EamA family transporter [Endozoicomonas sp. G2_1]MBO9491322.1 EamA family transporter [Endozoicomonas sp. G2_1]